MPSTNMPDVAAHLSPDASRPSTLSSHDIMVLGELDDLLRATYQLWDDVWVGFSWRNYTYDHVRRVRNLSISLAIEEGADTRVLDFAAVLHDITKSYDGEVLMLDGKRVIDEQGFWRNEFLAPARQNALTAWYDSLGLTGSLHNVSGARIADALLEEHGYPVEFRDHVAEIIVSHLKITEASSLEGRCLYDADTIDANIGYPAFYRNIQITMHRLEQQHAERGVLTDAFLAANLRDYLRQYVDDKLPPWIGSKERDFVGRLTTEAGRRRALARIRRLEQAVTEMQAEMDYFDIAVESGLLAPVVAFMHSRSNPSLTEEMAILEARWPAESSSPARRFVDALRGECEGNL